MNDVTAEERAVRCRGLAHCVATSVHGCCRTPRGFPVLDAVMPGGDWRGAPWVKGASGPKAAQAKSHSALAPVRHNASHSHPCDARHACVLLARPTACEGHR